MKRVFQSAEQTIHVWAQQTQSEGRSANVYFEGAVLYSYGRHYPLGLITTNKKGEKAAIINDAGYSATTAKHIGAARYAVNHYTRFSIPSTSAMQALVDAERYNKAMGKDSYNKRISEGLSEAIEHCINRYNSRLRSDTVKRKAATLEKWKSETLAECDSYITVLEWYGVKMTAKAKAAIKAITGKSPIEAREAAQKAAKIEAAKREKEYKRRAAEKAALVAQAIPAWLDGIEHISTNDGLRNTRDLMREQETVYLRVKGDNIETSKGVTFPIRHAVKGFALIQTVMKAGEAWQRNGKTLHLGEYQVDTIFPNGDVKAGCHFVQYAQIERVAKQLQLI